MALPALGLLGAGALAGGLSSLFRRKPRTQQISQFTPEQQQWQSQLGQFGSQQLQNPYEGFAPIEEQARTQFQTSTVPTLAERFTSMGSGGQRSSAFQSALGQAGAGLEQNLAALKSQYGMQNKQLGANVLGNALRPSFDTVYQQAQPGFLESALGGISGALGQYGTMGLANQMGAFGTPNVGESGQFGGLFNNPKFLAFLSNPRTVSFLKTQGII